MARASAKKDSTTTAATDACAAAAKQLPAEKRKAWVGFLKAHSVVTKSLDADLIGNFGLQLSGFEVLMRLDNAEQGSMRLSDLAKEALLSQSRISRLVTELAREGLVRRDSCATDSRVVYAAITDQGRERLSEISERHFDEVERVFFKDLRRDDVRMLAELWPRVIDAAESS